VSPAEGRLIRAGHAAHHHHALDPGLRQFTFTDSELRSMQEIDRSSEELFDPQHVKVERSSADGGHIIPSPAHGGTRARHDRSANRNHH